MKAGEKMYDKISNEKERIDKVKRVKEKIVSEIKNEMIVYKDQMHHAITDEDFEYFVRNSFALLELKKFLENEDSFMRYEIKLPAKDIVIYMVSDKNLSIWLEDDYSFIHNFLDKVEKNEYNVFPLLNDRFFETYFTNICDSVLYDDKKINARR